MKISFWIPAVVLYVVRLVFCNSVNVGTVLFTTTDLVKKCWTESDKSLLKARMIMQDVLPDPSCIDFSEPEAAVILLDYFHACYQIISTSTYGKVQNVMYVALSDALGGYLRAFVLPYTRKAFYAGEIKYSDAKKLFQLYDDIRIFLKTGGLGWAEPERICYKRARVRPLVITGGAVEACNQLYTIESQARLHCINAPYKCSDDVDSFKNSKESLREEDSEGLCRQTHVSNSSRSRARCADPTHNKSLFHNATATTHSIRTDRKARQNISGDKCRREIFHRKYSPLDAKRVIIPLPVLDDCGNPHSIAVPFRKRPFRNVGTDSSAFILEFYYLAVIKCFIAKGNTRIDIRNFNSQFHSWLVSEVFPHLNDERWYPAFGGVLRVMETIRKFGAETTVQDPVLHDIGYMFSEGVDFEITDHPLRSGREKTRDVTGIEEFERSTKRHYVTVVLVASLIWIFIFCVCAFYFQATRGQYLLYEGCSERTPHSRCEIERTGPKKECRSVNFEFLVKFFRKRESPSHQNAYQCLVENDRQKITKVLFDSNAKHNQSPSEMIQQKCVTAVFRVQEGKAKLVMTGQEEFPAFLISKSSELQQSPFAEPWTYILPVRKEESRRGREGQGEEGDNLKTLWKKPSSDFERTTTPREGDREAKERFEWTLRDTATGDTTSTTEDFAETSSHTCSASVEDETKGSSTEKRSSSCCCSENFCHSHTTVTHSLSHSQVEEEFSSETMKFFDNLITRHKNYKGKRDKGGVKARKDSRKGYKKGYKESTPESESEARSDYSTESNN